MNKYFLTIIVLTNLFFGFFSLSAQYTVPLPSWESVYKEVKSSADFKEALAKANLTENDLSFTNFGQLKHHCEKLSTACEGDRYDARVSILTKQNTDGISYKGEYTVSYYRSDKFCNLLPKFESGSKTFNEWTPVGKSSKVGSAEEGMALLKKGLSMKDIYQPFQQLMSYHISDVIKIDNIESAPNFNVCNINNSKFYKKNTTLSNNEVIVFTADLTWADFLFDEAEEKEEEDDDSEDDWNSKGSVYIYKKIEKIYKRKYLFNLWLDNKGNPIEIKYAVLNCEDDLPVDVLQKNVKYATLTLQGIEEVWNKTSILK